MRVEVDSPVISIAVIKVTVHHEHIEALKILQRFLANLLAAASGRDLPE